MTVPLRIAIVHYHLRPGGVTRVIEQAVAALSREPVRTVVLSGAPLADRVSGGMKVVVAEGVDYTQGVSEHLGAGELVQRLRQAATAALGGAPDVWHFHNHSLGKNCVLSRAVHAMAEDGDPLLLQIHDFAEDGRPSNYRDLIRYVADGDEQKLGARLYPQGEHVHYALLNGRDLDFMQAAGVSASCIHALPNPVSLYTENEVAPIADDGPLFLYPTRAIRRKNIGEFILWSVVNGGESRRFAITLAPTSKVDRPFYERWVAFCRANGIAVEFEAGLQHPRAYPAMLKSSSAIVTTSIAEGFGLAFLEPWLARRPLAGRDIPEMTREFKKAGLVFPALYDRLWLPVDWVGEEVLRSAIQAGLRELYKTYGKTSGPVEEERAVAMAFQDGRVDFARLNESMQGKVILRLIGSPSSKSEIGPSCLGADKYSDAMLDSNARLTREHFNLEQYAARLMEIYRAVAGSAKSRTDEVVAGRLLDRFLDPERFYLLRT